MQKKEEVNTKESNEIRLINSAKYSGYHLFHGLSKIILTATEIEAKAKIDIPTSAFLSEWMFLRGN